eukprot:PhM_4_TR8672/c0_g1_i1/m.76399/K14764/SHQ1; protein SHQ1
MITPQWTLNQNNDEVVIFITFPPTPPVRVDEAQFEIANSEFVFSCEPYYLHLVTTHSLKEGEGEHAIFNKQTQQLTIVLPKAVPGVNYSAQVKNNITVTASEARHTTKVKKVQQQQDQANDNNENLPPIPQELDHDTKEAQEKAEALQRAPLVPYGFDGCFKGMLIVDASTGVCSAVSVPYANTCTRADRMHGAQQEEEKGFSALHFWCDQNGGDAEDGSQFALHDIAQFVPYYARVWTNAGSYGDEGFGYRLPRIADPDAQPHAPLYTAQDTTDTVTVWKGNVDTIVKDGALPPVSSEASPVVPATKESSVSSSAYTDVAQQQQEGHGYTRGRRLAVPPNASDRVPFTDDEMEILAKLPGWGTPSCPVGPTISHPNPVKYGLVDLLLSYVYDHIVTLGEGNTESSWTLATLAGSLSWLRDYDSVEEVLTCFTRRALSLPLYCTWDLVSRCVQDTCRLLLLGPHHVVRALLSMHWVLMHDDHRHVLNDVVVDPYLSMLGGGAVVTHADLVNLAQEVHDAFDSVSLTTIGFNFDVDEN